MRGAKSRSPFCPAGPSSLPDRMSILVGFLRVIATTKSLLDSTFVVVQIGFWSILPCGGDLVEVRREWTATE